GQSIRPRLVDTVLVTIEAEKAAITADIDASQCVEHTVGRQSGIGWRLRSFHAPIVLRRRRRLNTRPESDRDCATNTMSPPSATARRYSALRCDRPQARSAARSAPATRAGARRGNPRGAQSLTQATKRRQIESAALTEICWATMARASVVNGSLRRTRWMPGYARTSRLNTRSRRARAWAASSQNVGFIDSRYFANGADRRAH